MSTSDFANLAGSRAVVTGSSSGIGRAIALELARAGANVVIHYRQSADKARSVVDDIKASGGHAVAIAADLADSASHEQFVEEAWHAFGGVDIWVNNAGADILTGAATKLDFAAKLDILLDVDVKATLLLSKLVGCRMSEQKSGTILNIGWDQADRGMEGDSGELFSASKNAIMGATRSLALSLAPHVRVNCIAPGWIRTAWGEQASDEWQKRVRRETPLQVWGTPEDIAAAARFLASREAKYITGQVINVNGGAIR